MMVHIHESDVGAERRETCPTRKSRCVNQNAFELPAFADQGVNFGTQTLEISSNEAEGPELSHRLGQEEHPFRSPRPAAGVTEVGAVA